MVFLYTQTYSSLQFASNSSIGNLEVEEEVVVETVLEEVEEEVVVETVLEEVEVEEVEVEEVEEEEVDGRGRGGEGVW
ncbi:hypothetical protein Pcinc_012523 [Petrolisthes cinctipes]|uniref:Uncharacterized protein n=1 Tax=Petrolisthes cinctipes TaxID=88211 RepID=A0AAE1FZ59_PETCI|nr:hypothetical protein Pcinc_012523 [Petrolisthes cinctipes]